MIISHRFRFIYIKTRKTGGTAIEIALSEFLGPDDVITSSPLEGIEARNCPPELRNRFGYYNGHEGQDYIRAAFPREWKDYYKFTSERHPVDKAVSGYRWALVSSERYREELGLELKKAKPKSLLHFLNSGRAPCDWSKYTEKNKVVVDSIIEHECINKDYDRVCREIGLPNNGLPIGVKKTQGPALDLGKEELEFIRDRFKDEIEYFKYEL